MTCLTRKKFALISTFAASLRRRKACTPESSLARPYNYFYTSSGTGYFRFIIFFLSLCKSARQFILEKGEEQEEEEEEDEAAAVHFNYRISSTPDHIRILEISRTEKSRLLCEHHQSPTFPGRRHSSSRNVPLDVCASTFNSNDDTIVISCYDARACRGKEVQSNDFTTFSYQTIRMNRCQD